MREASSCDFDMNMNSDVVVIGTATALAQSINPVEASGTGVRDGVQNFPPTVEPTCLSAWAILFVFFSGLLVTSLDCKIDFRWIR